MADVTRALVKERSIVRTWLMRGTLHVVAAEDVRWLLALVGPVFASANRARHAQLGLDDAVKAKGISAIGRILADRGPLTRYELVDELRRVNIGLDPRTQAPIHLIATAALNGVCCLGPERPNGEPTYVALDDWVPGRTSRSKPSLPELAHRYFLAYGPATLEDFAAWSGLPMPQARAGLAGAMPALKDVAIHGQSAFLPKGGLRQSRQHLPGVPNLRLLPAFDTYLLGYRRRDLAVSSELQRRLQRGGGWVHPAVVVDGRVVGTWKLRKAARRREVVVELEPGSRGRRTEQAVEREISDISRFLGEPVTRASS